MPDPPNLTAFQRDAMRFLAKTGRIYGLGLKRELEDWYGSPVNHGRLYPNLDKLVGAGLVNKGKIDDRTNWYELSERGRTVVEQFHVEYRDGVNAIEEQDPVGQSRKRLEGVTQ